VQETLPGGVCFGCGPDNDHGMQIQSFWEGEECICEWQPKPYHEGWARLTCGGVIATIVDCHCIATATAAAFHRENRPLDSEPKYLFATGSIHLRFLKPASVARPLTLRAHVTEVKFDKKYMVHCDVYTEGKKTAEADVVAILVYRSDRPDEAVPAFRPD